MSQQHRQTLSILILFVCGGLACEKVENAHISIDGGGAMALSSTKAIESARNATGFTNPNVTSAAAEVQSTGKLVPYIGAEASVWKVDFDNLKIVVGGREFKPQHVKHLSCFLSPTTGQIVKVESQLPEGVSVTQFPAIASQERQMKRVAQVFSGLPTTLPKISLMEAIASTDPETIWNAKQIIAYCVMEEYSEPKLKPRAVWVIHAWGIPPFAPIGGTENDVPEDARNHLRYIVNAETGQDYGSDTIPQPDSP